MRPTVDGKVISSISNGLMVLVGIGTGVFFHRSTKLLVTLCKIDDTLADVDTLSNKM